MKKTFFVMSFLLMSSLALAATIPKYVTVQGRLTDSNNVPVPSGSYLFNFTIWNDPTAGTLIWTDQFNAPVSNGVFNIELGRNAQLNIPFDQPYFLEIRVGGNLLSPRVNFTSAPYAFTSTSGGGGGGNGWTASGSTVYNNTAGTKVGIGTSNPSHELNVVGGLNVTSPAFFGGSVSLTSNNLQMNGNSITNVSWINASTYYDTGNSAYYLDPSGTSSLNKVGIGTASPSDKLEVAGNINVSSSGVYERGAAVGSSIGPCGANQYVGGATVSGGIVTGGSCQNDQTGGGGGNGWAVSGSTVYNNTAGTNVGIGTSGSSAKLSVVNTSATEISGTAMSPTFRTSAGALGTTAGNELSLASIGFTGTNNIALGIRGFRTYGGTDWTTTAIGLGMDVDNSVRAPSNGIGNTGGASLWLSANGGIGIGTQWPSSTLHVSGTNTLTANSSTGSNILSTYSISPSIDSNASYVADWFSLNTGNNQNLNGNLYGVAGQIYHWYNGIVDTAKGVDVWIQNNATGTIRHAWGFHVGGGNAAGGTIQDFRGVYIGAPGKASGTITNNYGIYLDNQTVGSASYAIYDAGGTNYFGDKVGIGTSSPTYQLQLSTDSAAKPGTNTWTISSDSRIKTNVSNFTDGLNVIMKMRPITYNYNGLGGFVDDGTMKVGIIAQELQSVAPYMITSHKAKLSSNDTNETNILDYQGSALAFVTVNAIKEQQQQIEEQNQQIEQLKAENLQLQQRLEKIENKLNLE